MPRHSPLPAEQLTSNCYGYATYSLLLESLLRREVGVLCDGRGPGNRGRPGEHTMGSTAEAAKGLRGQLRTGGFLIVAVFATLYFQSSPSGKPRRTILLTSPA